MPRASSPSSRRIWATGAVALMAAGSVAVLTLHPGGRPAAGDDAVHVVAAGEAASPSAPVATTASTAASDAGGPLPSFDHLSEPERQAVLAARPRDPAWAARTEAALHQRLPQAMDGVSIAAVTCADRLCVVRGQLAAAAIRDQARAVAQVISGPLDYGYAEAGLSKWGSVTINADDAGNLGFTQYLARRT